MPEITAALQEAFSEAPFSLVVVGACPASASLVRALPESAERCFSVVATRRVAGWQAGPLLALKALTDELTPALALRSAFRMDPDLIFLESSLPEFAEILETALTAAMTGHSVVLHVEDSSSPAPVLEAFASYLADKPEDFPLLIRRVVVCDEAGIAQVVDTRSGDALWSRGDPLPDLATLSGVEPRPAPPPAEPTPPLEPELWEQLRAALEPSLRATFLPRFEEPSGDAARSKLGGLPLLAPGEDWPRCGCCQEPMPLALQLARAECPPAAQALFPAEHLQLFYCSSSGCGAEGAWEPFADNRLLRFLPEGQPATAIPACPEPTGAMDLADWIELQESPHDEDVELPAAVEEARTQLQERVEGGEADLSEVPYAGARSGHRLLGWPAWTQAPEWPSCPSCGERMAFLFQIDAEQDPLRMLFAAEGTGHVTQCPQHPEVLAFGWAC